MQPFEDVFIENLENCSVVQASSGIQVKVLYAPADFFYGIVTPEGESFIEKATIPDGDLEFKEGKAWSWFNCLIDENELKTFLTGATYRKKFKTQLDVFLLGFHAQAIGFLEVVSNTPMVFAVTDSNGNTWIIGTKRNPASIDKADGSSGKSYSDNSGFSASISANTILYQYAGDINDFNRTAGDFNTDFNNDFLI